MQQPRLEAIKKPHKLKELCGLFCSKPKLFATYVYIIDLGFLYCQEIKWRQTGTETKEIPVADGYFTMGEAWRSKGLVRMAREKR
jgi:hypothetical protein